MNETRQESGTEVHRLVMPSGETVAYSRCTQQTAPDTPEILWLGGFHSDMSGTKALALQAWAGRTNNTCTRFDYFGHGASSGAFEQGTISRWLDDSKAVLERVTKGPQILVGSSMGGWISLLLARDLPDRVAGLVLIAPAPDFTEDLMWQSFTPEMRKRMEKEGHIMRPSQYDEEPYEISMALIEDGRRHLILEEPIAVSCPVRILHGMADPDVPWKHSLKIVQAVTSEDLTVTFVKGGDHRLSTPKDITLLERTVNGLLEDLKT